MKTRIPVLAALYLIAAAVPALSATTAPLPGPEEVAAEARRLMAVHDVKGMALAVIDDGRVVQVNAFGFANVERGEPLTTTSIMYGASLTKAAFACFVLQLVDEGKLDLDATIDRLLPRPLPEYEEFADLAGDERWRRLTPRIILNHATGFANFRWLEPDGKLRFHHDPGTRYGYSGEGFYILQLVVEEGLGLDVGAGMKAGLFDRFGLKDTSLQWRADFAGRVADGYALDGSFEPHDERSGVSAAGSMDTTIGDQALLWAAILRGEGLSTASRAEFVRSQLPIAAAHQFPTLVDATDPRGAAIGLAAGLGVVACRDAAGPLWFKGGHNDWTGNMLVCREEGRRGVVLLANCVRAELVYPELVRFILGESAMPWWWEYNVD